MLQKYFSLFVTAGAALAQAAAPVSFILTGDSTTATNGGWGDGFCGDIGLKSVLLAGTYCNNTAKGGATTGSFVAQGFWNIALDAVSRQVAKGNKPYVTIQFGHNDQKIAPPESMAANLTVMVKQLRDLGAEPVLVTSLTRRNFLSNGSVDDILGPWADATINVSKQQGTHLLDLHAASIEYVEAIGAAASHRLNLSPSDNTHLNVNGSLVFARLVADLFESSFPNILPINPDPALSHNISEGIPSF